MSKSDEIILGITIGTDTEAGIKLLLKSFEDKRVLEFCTPVFFVNTNMFSNFKKRPSNATKYSNITDLKDLTKSKLNILNTSKEASKTGNSEEALSEDRFLVDSLELASSALANNQIDGLISFPFSLKNTEDLSSNIIDEYTYFSNKFNKKGLKVFLSENYKVCLANQNLTNDPLVGVSNKSLKIDLELIQKMLKEEFTLSKPTIAIISKGLEKEHPESEVIRSLVAEMQSKSHLIYGPFQAESFFESCKHHVFDAILLVSKNDENLVKQLLKSDEVKYLTGFEKVITLPNIEATNNEFESMSSFYDAFFMSLKLVKAKRAYEELTRNPLKSQFKKYHLNRQDA